MSQKYYENSTEHITEELSRIDVMLGYQYFKAKQIFENKNEFHGLYISDSEMASFLKNTEAWPPWAAGKEPDISSGFESAGRDIEKKIQESKRRGVALKLDKLTVTYGLTRTDLDILILSLMSEINSGYEKMFAYLHDDMTKKYLSVGLAMDILGHTFKSRLAVRDRLTGPSPLVVHNLIHISSDPSFSEIPLVSRPLTVDERIVSWVLGENSSSVLFGANDDSVRIVQPVMEFDSLILSSSLKDEIRNAATGDYSEMSVVLYFHGGYGTGRKSAAQAVCRAKGMNMIVADLERILKENPVSYGFFKSLLKRADMLDALVCWVNADCIFSSEKKHVLNDLIRATSECMSFSFWIGDSFFELKNLPEKFVYVPFEFNNPLFGERTALWQKNISVEKTGKNVDYEPLAAAFAFSGGQIRDAVRTAKNHAIKKKCADISVTDLHRACLLQSSRKLAGLARKIRPVYTWEDIVLPPDRLEQLEDVVNQARYRSLVFDTWGFGKKLSVGKGLNVLFSGPSGTGKTMASEIMATDLGLHLYKIDLARVVSKYIGETEKNLSSVFNEAAASNAILFFDEADAIFGKRSEVHDAHDRYANIETSYLLQKMEEYEGITILATNFRRNMDEAFIRRIQHSIDFPFPEKHHRYEIWRKSWPDELPLSDDIDFGLLSDRFELSGGNIKNICIAAAFTAAADGRTVTMEHLVRATRSEFRKMGKLMMGGEFAELIRH